MHSLKRMVKLGQPYHVYILQRYQWAARAYYRAP